MLQKLWFMCNTLQWKHLQLTVSFSSELKKFCFYFAINCGGNAPWGIFSTFLCVWHESKRVATCVTETLLTSCVQTPSRACWRRGRTGATAAWLVGRDWGLASVCSSLPWSWGSAQRSWNRWRSACYQSAVSNKHLRTAALCRVCTRIDVCNLWKWMIISLLLFKPVPWCRHTFLMTAPHRMWCREKVQPVPGFV